MVFFDKSISVWDLEKEEAEQAEERKSAAKGSKGSKEAKGSKESKGGKGSKEAKGGKGASAVGIHRPQSLTCTYFNCNSYMYQCRSITLH